MPDFPILDNNNFIIVHTRTHKHNEMAIALWVHFYQANLPKSERVAFNSMIDKYNTENWFNWYKQPAQMNIGSLLKLLKADHAGETNTSDILKEALAEYAKSPEVGYEELAGYYTNDQYNKGKEIIEYAIKAKLDHGLAELSKKVEQEKNSVLDHLQKRAKKNGYNKVDSGSQDEILYIYNNLKNSISSHINSNEPIHEKVEFLKTLHTDRLLQVEQQRGEEELLASDVYSGIKVKFDKSTPQGCEGAVNTQYKEFDASEQITKSNNALKRLFQILFKKIDVLHVLETKAEKMHRQMESYKDGLKEDVRKLPRIP